jgi:GTPase SAR1 family protein
MGHSWSRKIQIYDNDVIFDLQRYFKKCLGAVLVYDITQDQTFYNIKSWLKFIKEQTESECMMILVGNKLDLCEDNPSKRMVQSEEAKTFAEENNMLFEETSALQDYNINKAFEDLATSNKKFNFRNLFKEKK